MTDKRWRSKALEMTRDEARTSLDLSVSVTDRQHVEAVVLVCDSCDYAARALNAQGIEPTAEAVAMLACKMAEIDLELRKLALARERFDAARREDDR
jgi:hypothetical protein